MQARAIREDQAQFLLAEIEKTYTAFGRSPSWLRPEDRAELREQLEASTKRAQSAIAIMNTQPGLIFELQALRGKLTVLSTMAEADLKTGREK